MPFSLEHYGDKAIVVNTQTGKHYSTMPIPIQSAKRQMSVLKQATASDSESDSDPPKSTGNKFIQEVVSSPNFKKGAFTAQAKKAGMDTKSFMREVLENPDKYSETTRKRAQFMENILCK